MENVQALEYRQMSELSDEHERLALDYARAMTDGKQQGDDDRFQIQNLFLEEDALVKLTGLIAFQDLSSKFNSALAMPAQEFCRLPKNVLSRAGGLDGKATKK